MPNKLSYDIITVLSKNPNYISGNKKELNLLLTAQRTAEQNPLAQKKFCAALTHYYCQKITPTLQIGKETIENAQQKGFLLDLQIIKYSILMLHNQILLDPFKKISQNDIANVHEQLIDHIELITAFEQIDFEQFMSFIKLFGYKNLINTFESILIEKFYLESGESYQKSSQKMKIPLTTLHSKRQKIQKEKNH